MGIWNSSLYGNDVTVDVRDTYIEALRTEKSDKEALFETLEIFAEYINTDEECLIWYSLADTQWKNGRLCDVVKNNAVRFLKQQGGKNLFNKDTQNKWINTIQKLDIQLSQPMKKYKNYKKESNQMLPLWNIGDVYAYRFSTKYSKDKALYGKYILMQKVDEIEGYYKKNFSVIHVFDKLFDVIPSSQVIREIRLLPLDTSHCTKETVYDFPLSMSAVMEYMKVSEYPNSRLTYLGNENITEKTTVYRNRSDHSWYRLEENWLCDFYLEWQGKKYVKSEDAYYPDIL